MNKAVEAESDIEQLAAMQQWMLDALIFPRRVNQAKLEERLLASPNQNVTARLAIYQRAYIMRLCKCLEDQFPALCFALGKPLFDDFACEYLREYPSDSYTLYELGRRFTDYLSQHRPDRHKPAETREAWIDFMLDLADYEYALFRLFDAPGNEGNSWPEPNVSDEHLVLQPCLVLSQYRFPVARYYHQVRDGSNPAYPPMQSSYVVITRKDYMTSSFPINRVHFLFLSELQHCGEIRQAIQRVAERLDRNVNEVADSWQQEVRSAWINAGFFIDRRRC